MDDFFPNPDHEDPTRKHNTQNKIPGINDSLKSLGKVSLQMGVFM